MSKALHLTITTPATVLVDRTDVRSVRAEDDSGGFGILPGHTDLLTVLPASVVRWRNGDGVTHYCALRGGVLTVSGGRRVAIASGRARWATTLTRWRARSRRCAPLSWTPSARRVSSRPGFTPVRCASSCAICALVPPLATARLPSSGRTHDEAT